MDDVGTIVQEILSHYAARTEGRRPVSETLAAFMTKATVLEMSNEFRPDKMLTEEDLDKLIHLVVDRLCDDKASTQTIRMQVGFDETFLETERDLDAIRADTRQKLGGIMSSIANVEEADYDTAKALYRQIFNFLVTAANADSDIKNQAAAHREIAAALESVFPRAGLTTFVTMPLEDKKTHLDELRRIVMGIRLFNQSLGKGGAGIKDLVAITRRRVEELTKLLNKQHSEIQDTCDKYSAVLVHVHRLARAGEKLPDKEIVQNWKDEHNNRRQLLAYLSCLLDDAYHSSEMVDNLETKMHEICAQLDELVGQNTTLPKTTVYPLFDELGGSVWSELEHELAIVRSRKLIWDCLQEFYDTCPDTIDPAFLHAAASAQPDQVEDGDFLVAESSDSHNSPTAGEGRKAAQFSRSATEKLSNSGDGIDNGKSRNYEESKYSESKNMDSQESRYDAGSKNIESKQGQQDSRKSVLIPPSTPGFGDLVLALQAFCPYTLAKRNGLLLLGDAQLGVVQFREQYYVFQDKHARDAFIKDPVPILQGVIDAARASPELIHLLQLEQFFPQVAMGTVLRTTKGVQGPTVRKKKVDASTSTPTHFVEKHIDPNYHWNEWELRRRAIKIVNLRHAKTRSVQTVSSHFRRETETQVYLPRDSSTQTGIQRGTNPPRQHQYIVGLRGLRKSRFARDFYDARIDAEQKRVEAETKASFAGVVRLTYDL